MLCNIVTVCLLCIVIIQPAWLHCNKYIVLSSKAYDFLKCVADFQYCLYYLCQFSIVWWQCKQIAEIDERKAVRFHARNFKLKLLRAWVDAVASEKQAAKQNNVLAEQHSIEWVAQSSTVKVYWQRHRNCPTIVCCRCYPDKNKYMDIFSRKLGAPGMLFIHFSQCKPHITKCNAEKICLNWNNTI